MKGHDEEGAITVIHVVSGENELKGKFLKLGYVERIGVSGENELKENVLKNQHGWDVLYQARMS